MLPDRVSNPGPLTYESGALLIALCGPASIPKPMALNLPLTFSVQFTKAVLRSSAIFRSSSLRYCLKSSAILRPNYFRYVWKSSLHYGMNCCMMLELFSNFSFKFTLAPYKNACLENLVRDVLHEGSAHYILDNQAQLDMWKIFLKSLKRQQGCKV